jgi:hypothetical protein
MVAPLTQLCPSASGETNPLSVGHARGEPFSHAVVDAVGSALALAPLALLALVALVALTSVRVALLAPALALVALAPVAPALALVALAPVALALALARALALALVAPAPAALALVPALGAVGAGTAGALLPPCPPLRWLPRWSWSPSGPREGAGARTAHAFSTASARALFFRG